MADKDFRRKDDYSPETVASAQELIKLCGEVLGKPILTIPGADSIICYYRGLPFVYIKDGNWGRFGKDYEEYFEDTAVLNDLEKKYNGNYKELLFDKEKNYNNLETVLDRIAMGMSGSYERRTAQAISMNNISFETGAYSVCGFETSPGSGYFEGKTVRKKDKSGKIKDVTPNPGVDIVAFCPAEKRMLLIEYKCRDDARSDFNSGVEAHCREYSMILEKSDSDELDFCGEMLKAYRLMCVLYGKTVPAEITAEKLDIAFLMTENCENFNEKGRLTENGDRLARNAVKSMSDIPLERIFWYWEKDYNDVVFKGENFKPVTYIFPFGQGVRRLSQQDRTPKKVFVLGVYASAVHAKWIKKNGKPGAEALAVASEPRIFWEGDRGEAEKIISGIYIPPELGHLEPADDEYNGPSGRTLNEKILAPLGYTREEAWLCDLLPESRRSKGQDKRIKESYDPIAEKYGLPKATVPPAPDQYEEDSFCDDKRRKEILGELKGSGADAIILLGDAPIRQFLCKVAKPDFSSLRDFTSKHPYGEEVSVIISGREYKVIPLAHPKQIGKLGDFNEKWFRAHEKWLESKSLRD